MPRLTLDEWAVNEPIPPRPQTALPSFGGSRRSPRATNNGGGVSPRLSLARLTIGSTRSSRSNSNGRRNFFGGGKRGSTTNSPKDCPDSPITNKGYSVESESPDGEAKYHRQFSMDIADNIGDRGSIPNHHSMTGKMEVNALKRNLEVAMTTIVQLQAQLGQSHLKVERLLKQKQELMALCQDHAAAQTQVDDDSNANVTAFTTVAPSTPCPPLIIPSVQHSDKSTNDSSDDGVIIDGNNEIKITGARIDAATQTILDEVRLLLKEASKERRDQNLEIKHQLKQLNSRELPSDIQWPSNSSTTSSPSLRIQQQPNLSDGSSSRRYPGTVRPNCHSFTSSHNGEQQNPLKINPDSSNSNINNSKEEYGRRRRRGVPSTLSRTFSRRSPKMVKPSFNESGGEHDEDYEEDCVGFANHYHHQSSSKEESSHRATLSLSCSTDVVEESICSSYCDKNNNHHSGDKNDWSTCSDYESGTVEAVTINPSPQQVMVKNPSCSSSYHHTGYDEERNSDNSCSSKTRIAEAEAEAEGDKRPVVKMTDGKNKCEAKVHEEEDKNGTISREKEEREEEEEEEEDGVIVRRRI